MPTDLHVAALPFPSPQGTQAAIASMMEVLVAAGREARLLTYAHGATSTVPSRFEHLRIERTYGDRSLRSGPSLAKVAQDLELARAIRRARPEVVIAHHVEAAAAALLARARPLVFVAHTALGPELPTYFDPALRAIASRAGDALDRALLGRADVALAVSPLLARRLAALSGRDVRWLPIPWSIPTPTTADERAAARAALGMSERDHVMLYVGNLDRYQGLDELWRAVESGRERHRDRRLVIATASDAREVPASARVLELDGTEAQRRDLHAAADLVVVPRESEGGLPVKLIDALARGVPVACSERATAGLALDGVAIVERDLERAIERAALDVGLRTRAAIEGPRFVARELSPARFVSVLDDARSTARAARTRCPA